MSSPTAELSLFHIEREMLELIALREDGVTPEEQAVIDQQIEQYVRSQVRKVDNIREFLRYCDVMATAAQGEMKRYADIVREWEERRAKVESYVIKVMQEFGERKLTGAAGGSLQVKGNGGVQPLTITDETLLPPDCFTAKVRLPWTLWLAVQAACEWQSLSLEGAEVRSEVNNKAVREHMPVDGARLEQRGVRLEVK